MGNVSQYTRVYCDQGARQLGTVPTTRRREAFSRAAIQRPAPMIRPLGACDIARGKARSGTGHDARQDLQGHAHAGCDTAGPGHDTVGPG